MKKQVQEKFHEKTVFYDYQSCNGDSYNLRGLDYKWKMNGQ